MANDANVRGCDFSHGTNVSCWRRSLPRQARPAASRLRRLRHAVRPAPTPGLHSGGERGDAAVILGDIELSLAPCPALGRACKAARNGILDRSLMSFLGFSRRSDRSLGRLHGGIPFQPYGTGCRSAKIARSFRRLVHGRTLGRKRSRNQRPTSLLAATLPPCQNVRSSSKRRRTVSPQSSRLRSCSRIRQAKWFLPGRRGDQCSGLPKMRFSAPISG